MVIDAPSNVIEIATPIAQIARPVAPGAIACVKRVMLKSLNRNLSIEQSTALWIECRTVLLISGARRVVREIEEDNETGGLDTYPREFLMDAVSLVLTGATWPANMDSQADSDGFIAAMKASFNTRGYARNVFED